MLVRAVACVSLAFIALTGGVASADDQPPADEDARNESDEPAVTDQARRVYDQHLRHRLPRKLTAVVDGAFALYDARELRRALPELWRQLRDDPDLEAIVANLANQYRPRLDYAGYVGAVAHSAGYAGLAVGAEADVSAPLCRYLGGSFDGQLFAERDGRGAAYDTRVTGCLPWGPFALELGFTAQRSVQMGLAAAPTSAARRYDARGFELRIRGFRWMHPAWELVTIPAEVSFVDLAPDTGDGRESAHVTVDSAFLRYHRYRAGPGGEDRTIEAIPVHVTSEQDVDGAMLSATVVGVGLVRLTGLRVATGWFIDANVEMQQASIGPTTEGAERDVSLFTGGVDLALHWVNGPYRVRARYHRGLIPDAAFRLLSDDRGEFGIVHTRAAASLGAEMFVAYTRTAALPAGGTALPDAATYGARFDVGYALHGPLYVTARAEAARSFYAGDIDAVRSKPAHEVRFTAGLAASAGSHAKR